MRLVFNSSNSLTLNKVNVVRISDHKALVEARITKEEFDAIQTEKCILLKCKIYVEGIEPFNGCVLIKKLSPNVDGVGLQLKLMADNVNIPYELIGG